MLPQFSHRFNLEHTLESSNQKAKTVISLQLLFQMAPSAYFQILSGWKILLFYITWVVQRGTFSSMFAPSLNIIHCKKRCSFLQLFNQGIHSLFTCLLPSPCSFSFTIFHSLSSAQEAVFSTIQPQLHCISHSFQHAII
jgi:hypothetical protein